VIIEIARDPGEFQRAFHHPEWRVAVAIHNSIGKRSVIRADPHGDAALLAKIDQRRKPFADSIQLGCVLLIAVFANQKLFRVGVIARIDSHLVHPFRSFHGGFRF